MRLSRWARATLFTGALLLAIAIVPLWLATLVVPDFVPVLFSLAFFLLAPPGAMIFIAGLLMFLFAIFRP